MTSGDDFAIDALAGFLPLAARDRLAETLTPAEIDTLTHLAKTGTGPNSLRALLRLAYLEAWARAARLRRSSGRRRKRPCCASSPIICGTRKSARKIPSTACRGGRRGVARRGSPEIHRPACAGDGAPAPRTVVQPASLARPRRPVRQSVHSQRPASRHSRRRSAARAQKRLGDHARRSRSAARDLRAGQGGRSARPRASVARLRLRRAPPLGNRAAQSRRSRRARAGRRRR